MTAAQEQGTAAGERQVQSPRCAPFAARRMQRQLAVDRLAWWGLLAGLVVAVAWGGMAEEGGGTAANVTAVVILVAWVWVSLNAAQVMRQLPRLAAALDSDPQLAEAQLAAALKRAPLQRPVRLLLYHRLAVLRHRQNRCREAGAICQSLLTEPSGPLRGARAALLLMLAESRLVCGEPMGAFAALLELSRLPLNLMEVLQKLMVQTRYEVGVGLYAAALHGLPQKVAMAELMPAGQCGAMHGLLALAAQRAEHRDEAAWLLRRAQLLCEPRQLSALGLPTV